MKNKITMEALSQELNISKTTISKALNNCPGISPLTKHIITQTASSYGYSPNLKAGKISVILPSIPDHFWGKMRRSISAYSQEANIKCNYYIYPNLLDNVGAMHCINQALNNDTSVLILAVPNSPEIRKKLEASANNILIILIEEFIDIKNVFYVGENSFRQGYSLAKTYISAYPDSNHFTILHATDFHTENQRIEGFISAIKECGKHSITHIQINSETKAKSANIARQLADLKNLPDCIFCPSGNIVYASGAVKKLNRKIHCIGFDMHTEKDKNNNITHLLIQDTDNQVKKACECAKNFLHLSMFPDCKNIYIDGVLLANQAL